MGQNLNSDIEKGVFDRFRSLPIGRSVPLVGAVIADVGRYPEFLPWVVATRGPAPDGGTDSPELTALLGAFPRTIEVPPLRHHVEDVAAFADAKIAALHAHTSQLLSTMAIDEAASPEEAHRQSDAFDQRIRDRLAERGGEAFKVMADL